MIAFKTKDYSTIDLIRSKTNEEDADFEEEELNEEESEDEKDDQGETAEEENEF